MKIAVVTMVYNEGTRLQRWIGHYASQVGISNLLIVDHGSDDGSTDRDDVSRIRLPRSPFDDIQRASFISDLCRSLFNYYDAMIYADCDELIVADPSYFPNLTSYIEALDVESVRPLGLDLIHIRSRELPFDWERPIFEQRSFCRFRSVLCKPLIAKAPVRWAPGFHHCDKRALVDRRIYLFHTKQVDFDAALNRQKLTRELDWSQRSLSGNMGIHQRRSDNEMTNQEFDIPANALLRDGAKQFSVAEFDKEVTKLETGLELAHGIYRSQPYIGSFFEIPERLRTAL